VAVLQSDLAFSVFVLHVNFEKHQRLWDYFNLLERKDNGVLALEITNNSLKLVTHLLALKLDLLNVL
jgi:hypothetical protein